MSKQDHYDLMDVRHKPHEYGGLYCNNCCYAHPKDEPCKPYKSIKMEKTNEKTPYEKALELTEEELLAVKRELVDLKPPTFSYISDHAAGIFHPMYHEYFMVAMRMALQIIRKAQVAKIESTTPEEDNRL